MRRKFLPLILGGALAIAAVAPAAASNHQTVNQDAVQRALVGLIVQAAVRDVELVTLRDSLNNLLRDADIDVNLLNESLNNILQNVNVSDNTITVIGDDLQLTVAILSGVVTVSTP
jgi:hypothetical protein